MPIIKSAIKRAHQNTTRRTRNHAVLSRMRSLIKKITQWTKEGEVEKAARLYPEAQKAIANATKKNLIHKNNAARKQAAITKEMNKAGAKTSEKYAPAKA